MSYTAKYGIAHSKALFFAKITIPANYYFSGKKSIKTIPHGLAPSSSTIVYVLVLKSVEISEVVAGIFFRCGLRFTAACVLLDLNILNVNVGRRDNISVR